MTIGVVRRRTYASHTQVTVVPPPGVPYLYWCLRGGRPAPLTLRLGAVDSANTVILDYEAVPGNFAAGYFNAFAMQGAYGYVLYDPTGPGGAGCTGIARIALDGAPGAPGFITFAVPLLDVSLTVTATHVYWMATDPSTAVTTWYGADLDGSHVVTLGSQAPQIISILQDPLHPDIGYFNYWSPYGGSQLVCSGNYLYSIVNQSMELVEVGSAALGTVVTVLPDYYWIQRFDLTTGAVDQLPGISLPNDAAFTVDDRHVYWAAPVSGWGPFYLGRAELDRAGVEDPWITPSSGPGDTPEAMLVTSAYIYVWATVPMTSGCGVWRFKRDGSSPALFRGATGDMRIPWGCMGLGAVA